MSDAYDNEFGYLESACAAGARYEDAPCDYVGVIEAEPADDSRHGELLTGHGFECTTTMVDAFTIAADIDAFDVWTWLVDDEAVLVEADYRPWNELRYFMMGLNTWFRREHTDTDELDVLTFYNYLVAGEVPKVLAVIDQYVSESAD